jgi:hypothetical protein
MKKVSILSLGSRCFSFQQLSTVRITLIRST